jgi:transposase InsO family protein
VWPAPGGATETPSGDRISPQAKISHHDPVPGWGIAADNKLNQRFEVGNLDQAWVGDITFIATGSGWLYLAVLLDLYSRRVVGWAMSERIDQQLVLDALIMALVQLQTMASPNSPSAVPLLLRRFA